MTRHASRAAAERRLLELHAATCSILAHPTRLAMIEALTGGERTVTDLVDAVGTSAGNLSQHLGAMRGAGLVEAIRDGRTVSYQLSDPQILAACGLMRDALVRRLSRLGDLAAAVHDSNTEFSSSSQAGHP